MNFTLSDFFVKYDAAFLPKLYNINLEQTIINKEEFWELRLPIAEKKPEQRGELMKHQEIVRRLLSSYTPYDEILLFHEPGTGKTCSMIGIIEECRESMKGSFTKSLILTRGETLWDNFIEQLVFVCTDGRYIPEDYEELTPDQKTIRTKKMISDFYTFDTFQVFSKKLAKLSDEEVRKRYEGTIIVVDEVHNLRPNESDEGVTPYNEINRLIHLLSNRKVILGSATPMQDSPEEIAGIMNLILPEDNQLPMGSTFRRRYLIENERGYYFVNKQTEDELSQYFRGRVSYIKAQESDVQKKFVGTLNNGMEYFITDKIQMGEFQSENYDRAIRLDTGGKEGVFNNSRQASLLVFPDGSWGKDGFKKYILDEKKKDLLRDKVIHTYKLGKEFADLFRGKNYENDEDREEMLSIISLYSVKYATIIRSILKNSDKNAFVYIDLVTGSGCIVFSLLLRLFGFSAAKGGETTSGRRYGLLTGETSTDPQIREITRTFNDPANRNGARIQVIIGSSKVSEGLSFKNVQMIHVGTPHWNYSETEQAIARGVRLFSHRDLGSNVTVKIFQYLAEGNSDSIDSRMYLFSERKDVSIKHLERLIKTTAVDCALTIKRNRRHSPGERPCDYMDCDYECRYVSVEERESDYDSYNYLYSFDRVTSLKKQIVETLRERQSVTVEEIKILYPEYTDYEISSAITTLIDNNVNVRNKFGLLGWIREDSGIIYLSPELSSTNLPTSQYYLSQPYLYSEKSITEIEEEIFSSNLSKLIDRMISSRNEEELREIIINLPQKVQVMFLENAVLADVKKIKYNQDFRRRLLAYFAPYINRNLEDTIVHNFIEVSRCFDIPTKTWSNCPEDIGEMVEEELKEQVKKLETNDYGYYGIFNKATNKFQIRDVSTDIAVTAAKKSKQTKGKVCTSWSGPDLVKITHALKLDYVNEHKGKSKAEIIKIMESTEKYKDSLIAFPAKVLSKMSPEDVERIAYYGTKKKSIICQNLKEWFEVHDLLKIE